MGNIKAKWVGIGGIVFSDGKILDYTQLLPIINEIQEEREKTSRSYEKLKQIALEVVGECGLNGSINKLEKVLNDLEEQEISNVP